MRATLVGEGQNYEVVLTSGDLEQVASQPISCKLQRGWVTLEKTVRLSFGAQSVSFLPPNAPKWESIEVINILMPDAAYSKLRDGLPYEFSQGAYSVIVRR